MFSTTPDASPVLYKRDTKGKVRIWYMTVGMNDHTDAGHTTTTGLEDGKKVTSEWTRTEPKNVGKANETSSYEQAKLEVEAQIKKKLKAGYFMDKSKIDEDPVTRPMLAENYDDAGTRYQISDGVIAQPKLDGIRMIARADGLWTRKGEPIITMNHVWNAVEPWFLADPALELDGELYNHDFHDDFNKLTSLIRREKTTDAQRADAEKYIQFHIYDMPSHTGDYWDRAVAIRALLAGRNDPVVQQVEFNWVDDQDTLDALYHKWVHEEFYEGQMVRLNLPYENKRTWSLLKRKEWITAEFPVLSMLPGKGNWSGAAKTATVLLPSGVESEATFKGSRESLTALWDSQRTPNWATVKFFGYTKDGKLRFPSIVDWGYGERKD